MTKELEALQNIGLWGYQDSEGDLILCRMNNKEDFAIIEVALRNYEKLNKDYSRVVDEKIELAIMCAKEHEALRIIVEKDVNLADIRCCATVEQYNVKENGNIPLTQEEFNLLKEVTLWKEKY